MAWPEANSSSLLMRKLTDCSLTITSTDLPRSASPSDSLDGAFSGGAASATISPSLAVAGAAAWAVASGAAHSGGMATLSNSEYSPS